MTDPGEVDALAEGARGDDAVEAPVAEGPLDAQAPVAVEAGVVVRDARGELGHAVAQRPHERDRLVAGGRVHDAPLAPRDDGDERRLTVAQVALVVYAEVRAARLVEQERLPRRC